MGFRFDLNTSATHHNPIICTRKKQKTRQRPAKTTPLQAKDFWREISSENFKSVLTKEKQKRREEEDTLSGVCRENLLEI
jgi:hypothetical protein